MCADGTTILLQPRQLHCQGMVRNLLNREWKARREFKFCDPWCHIAQNYTYHNVFWRTVNFLESSFYHVIDIALVKSFINTNIYCFHNLCKEKWTGHRESVLTVWVHLDRTLRHDCHSASLTGWDTLFDSRLSKQELPSDSSWAGSSSQAGLPSQAVPSSQAGLPFQAGVSSLTGQSFQPAQARQPGSPKGMDDHNVQFANVAEGVIINKGWCVSFASNCMSSQYIKSLLLFVCTFFV